MVLMQVYILASVDIIPPLAKENNSMAKASSMPCKTTRHPLSSNKSLAIEKSCFNNIKKMKRNYLHSEMADCA
jgi:hypothetical protein